jgi:hypothetical protein
VVSVFHQDGLVNIGAMPQKSRFVLQMCLRIETEIGKVLPRKLF